MGQLRITDEMGYKTSAHFGLTCHVANLQNTHQKNVETLGTY